MNYRGVIVALTCSHVIGEVGKSIHGKDGDTNKFKLTTSVPPCRFGHGFSFSDYDFAGIFPLSTHTIGQYD